MNDTSYPMQQSDLDKLIKERNNLPDFFGISRIQRLLGVGYNRAAYLVDFALEKNIIVRDTTKPYLLKINFSESS